MDTSQLLEWEKQHNAANRTLEGFWSWFNIWRKECKDNYHELFLGKLDDDFIATQVTSINLKHRFNYDPVDAIVICHIAIFYLGVDIGYYQLSFLLNGVTEDDSVQFHEKSWMQAVLYKPKYSLRIAKKALKEGLDPELISKITELEIEYIQILKQKLHNNAITHAAPT